MSTGFSGKPDGPASFRAAAGYGSDDGDGCVSPPSLRKGFVTNRELAIDEGYAIIERKFLDFQREIGSGSFGTVHLALWAGPTTKRRSKGMQLAVKVVPPHKGRSGVFRDDLEVSTLSQLSHRNVVRFHGVAFSHSDETLIVTEFCANGSLRDCIDKGMLNDVPFTTKRRDPEARSLLAFTLQVLAGLRYLHDESATTVVHRDLKSANVLVTEGWTMKIADFGSAKQRELRLTTFAGTPAYMAPEMLRQDEDLMGTPGDIWSFGVLLWELITLATPHTNVNPSALIFSGGLGKLHLPVPEDTPEPVKALLANCWRLEPHERPTAYELVRRLDSIEFDHGGEIHEKMVKVIGTRNDWMDELHNQMRIDANERNREFLEHEESMEVQKEVQEDTIETFANMMQSLDDDNRRLKAVLALAVVVIVLLVIAVVLRSGDTKDAGMLFNRANTNDDDLITEKELTKNSVKAVLQGYGINVESDAELATILARYDTNRGGNATGMGLDRSEFKDLVAGETSGYSQYRTLFVNAFGIDHTFSLGRWIHEARESVLLGREICVLVGMALLGRPMLVFRQRVASAVRPTLGSMFLSLMMAALGSVVLAIGAVDQISTHFGSRELLRFTAVASMLWLVAIISISYTHNTKRSPRPAPPPFMPQGQPSSVSDAASPGSIIGGILGSSDSVFDDVVQPMPGGSLIGSGAFQRLKPELRNRFLRKLSDTSGTRRRSKRLARSMSGTPSPGLTPDFLRSNGDSGTSPLVPVFPT